MTCWLLRLTQVTCAVIWCLLAAGPVYGFAAFKPILISEGVYSHLCTENELQNGKTGVCSQQDVKLNYIFTVAIIANNIFILPGGYLLSSLGPRACGFIGALFLALACFCFTNPLYPYVFGAQSILQIDPYLCGYSFLGAAGPFVFISCFQLSNAFPRLSSALVIIFNASFNASSALFTVYRALYNSMEGGFTLKQFFNLYFGVPLFILIAQLTIMPSTSYQTHDAMTVRSRDALNAPPQHNFIDSRQFDLYSALERRSLVEEQNSLRAEGIEDEIETIEDFADHESELINHVENSGVWGVLHGVRARRQLWSFWFIFIVLFSSIQVIRINYLIQTISSQYAYLLHSDQQAERLNNYLTISLPVAGVLVTPVIGFVLDSLSTLHTLVLSLFITTIIGVVSLLHSAVAGYLVITLLVLYRPFFYAVVLDYCAKVFGFDTFGTIYGLCISISGVLSYLQFILDKLTHTYFKMSPNPANLILTSASIFVGVPFCLHMFSQTRAIRRKQLEDEAERAPLLAMPGTSYTEDDSNDSVYGH